MNFWEIFFCGRHPKKKSFSVFVTSYTVYRFNIMSSLYYRSDQSELRIEIYNEMILVVLFFILNSLLNGSARLFCETYSNGSARL